MYKVGENRQCTEWPLAELEHLTVKSTLYSLNTYPWDPNFGPFHCTISHFRDNNMNKDVKNRKCTKWPQTELEHIHTKCFPLLWGPNFGPFRSTTSGFQDIAYLVTPHWLPCQIAKIKEEKKLPQIQYFEFHYSFNKFDRDSPQEYIWILGSKSGVFFQRRCRLKLCPDLVPYVNEDIKKNGKNSKFESSQFFEQLW